MLPLRQPDDRAPFVCPQPAALAAIPARMISSPAPKPDHFGVTEANWQEGARRDPHFIASETPFYIGRAIAALAADPNIAQKSGRAFSSWGLAAEYGFVDKDGRQPDWGKYFQENVIGQA